MINIPEIGQTGQIKEVYIKKINNIYYIAMETLTGHYHTSRPHIGHSYVRAKTILRYWRMDLKESGPYYRVSRMGDIFLYKDATYNFTRF